MILQIRLANAKRNLWQWWRNIFAERLSGCAEFHMVRLIEPLFLHVFPGETWLVLFVDVFALLFEPFLSRSKLQWCVVEFQELWWDRRHWWQPMKATTLKQRVWTWMVRLPDSLCKHQQESENLWHLFCEAFTTHFRCAASDKRDCTISVCGLFVKHALGGYKVALGFRGMQTSEWLEDSVCAFPWPCVLCCCVCCRQQHRITVKHKKATTVWFQSEERWID